MWHLNVETLYDLAELYSRSRLSSPRTVCLVSLQMEVVEYIGLNAEVESLRLSGVGNWCRIVYVQAKV